MNRTLRISLTVGSVVVLLVVIVSFLIPVNRFRPAIEDRASAALGRKVDLGRLRLSVLSGSLWAETLAVADDPAFSTSPFVTAKSVKVGVKLWPLIASGSLDVTGITIQDPEVALIRNSAGRWNYSSLGSSSGASGDFSIKKLELKNGRMIVGSTTSQKRSVYDHVQVTASDVSSSSACPVIASASLPGAGTFRLAGTIGPVNQADASRTPLVATIAVERLNLATTGFLDPSAGLGGLLDLKATVVAKSDEAAVVGRATVSKALLVAGGSPASQPLVVKVDTRYNLHTHSGVLNPSTFKIGGADGRLTGTYDARGEYTVINTKMAGERMPAPDLESFLPALGIHLPKSTHLAAGTVAANLTVVGATNRLVTTGNVGLFNAKLSGFDLGARVRAISDFTGLNTGSDLDIEGLTTNLRMAPDGLRFDHFDAVVRSLGHLTGAGTIDARNRLDFKMVAMLTHPLGGGVGTAIGTAGALNEVLGMLTGGDAVSRARGQRIPFLVRGTTSDPEFVPDVSGVVLQTLQQQMGTHNAKPDANRFGAIGGLFTGTKQ
jgi:AsmA protein